MTRSPMPLSCLVVLLTACGGASSGTEPPKPDASDGDTATGLLSLPSDPTLDAECGHIAGFTARSILKNVHTRYTGTYTGKGAGSPLPITVAYAGHVICTPAKMYTGHDPVTFPAQITVDLDMTFKTANGTFDESFTATVTSSAPPLPDVQFSGSVKATALKGTYEIAHGPASGDAVTFQGELNYPKAGQTGGIVEEETSTISAGEGSW